ncbi:FAD-dependent monooxygenase [Streptomyces sp. H27-D2]|nr:FAD-dependent monooxygenase [Streptomyces sp. H27-D2]MEC4015935.1 FAD-dependent monooxygenase [Streptomyces sp. H27-D2]
MTTATTPSTGADTTATTATPGAPDTTAPAGAPAVLIVGAGPTGLTLACDLARRGVPFRLVDAAAGGFPGSRGKGIQPRTQEVFDDLGLIEAVRAAGCPLPMMRGWKDGRTTGDWYMNERGEPTPGIPYAEGWMVPQSRTQEILRERLAALGGAVEFGTALSGFAQDGTAVTAALTHAGAAGTARFRYLVAADGGRSTVRRVLGTPFTGQTVDTQPMLVADLDMPGLPRTHWHVWPEAPGGAVMLCPLPGTEAFQLFARFDGDAEPDPDPAAVRALVAERVGLRAGTVHWSSPFRVRAAMAERFRDGRVFLAGDAAHIHSPAGGQGLNTSVQDAYNLGWKLGQVLLHGAPEGLLDSYESERMPVAADVLGLSTRLHRGNNEDASRRRGCGPNRRRRSRGRPVRVRRRRPPPRRPRSRPACARGARGYGCRRRPALR